MTSENNLGARQAALAALEDIFVRRKSLDEASRHFLKLEDSRDRAFARLLVATVLKRAPQIDLHLQTLLTEPLAKLKPPRLLNVLRLGMAQFAFLGTAAHAAVNTTVDLAGVQKPLVNAVMRRLTREGFPATENAGEINTQAWLWKELVTDYGVETARAITAAHFDEAPLDITVKNDPDRWAKVLSAEKLLTGSLRKAAAGFVPDLPGFADGEWWVQNAAAALPAKLIGNIRGKYVVDLCAAPGGKTAQLATMGAFVTAVDRSADRLQRLEENMTRLKLKATPVTADGAAWKPQNPVDAVLLDAPCTATGTIRHQPDVPYLKDRADQEKLSALQRRLLENAAKMLKPGGTLIYCTCSLQKDEGERQTDWALANLPLKLSPIAPAEIGGIGDMITARGELRALPKDWPDRGGIDGFYIARFTRS